MKMFAMFAVAILTAAAARADHRFSVPRGPNDAPVTVIMFGDFQCPFTYRGAQIMNQLQREMPGEFKLVFRHYPLDFHPYAFEAAKASQCAGEQEKFWQMYDDFFSDKVAGHWTAHTVSEAVDRVGLNRAIFDQCMASPATANFVHRDQEEGQLLQVSGTPNMILVSSKGLKKIDGAYPADEMKKHIREMNPKSE